MSEVQGSNPITGEAHPSATAEQDDKQAKREAAEALRIGKRHDASLVKALESVAKSIDGLAVAIANCQTPIREGGPAPWQLVTDEEGRPFPTWQKYLEARLAPHTFLHKVLRDEVIVLLLESGMSIRQAAAATNSSVGTAAGAKKRAAQPGGESAGVEATPASANAKLVTQVINVSVKVVDKVDSFSDTELEQLRLAATAIARKVTGMQKLRADIAAAESAKAQAPKPGPKVPAQNAA